MNTLCLKHGGDIYSTDRSLLDFSTSINPLGLPDAVRQAFLAGLDQCMHYPDPLNRKLRDQLAKLEHCPAEMIVCGNGAADLIYRLAHALRPRRALLLAPTFSEYAQALDRVGCEMEYHRLVESKNFELDDTILDAIQPELDVLFLCNPNNPNGWPAPRSLMQRILQRCNLTNTHLIVDECFIDLLPDPARFSLVDQVRQNERLIILKAMTKTFAMAGVRLGYMLCSDQALVEQVWHAGPPWNVSAFATIGGIAAADCLDHVEQSRRLIQKQRRILADGLTQLGMKVYPSAANYLLFFSPDPTLHHKLHNQGILIRNCSNFKNLGPGFYRVAVRLPEDQNQLLAAIKKTLGGYS